MRNKSGKLASPVKSRTKQAWDLLDQAVRGQKCIILASWIIFGQKMFQLFNSEPVK